MGFVEFLVLQQGVEALDGGDADVGALVDEAAFQALHRVQLRKLAVIVDRHVGHHFLLGLFAEVFGVDQGLFQIGDGRFLAIAQAQLGGRLIFRIERRQCGEAGAQTTPLGQPVAQGFRAVEAEDFTRTRLGVAGIGEVGDDAGGFVAERQRFAVIDSFEPGGGIAFGLRLVGGEALAFFFALGFDDAKRLAVDEEHVIGGAGVGLPFADRDPGAGGEIDLLLHNPAGGAQLRIDPVAGLLFGVLVFAHRQGVKSQGRYPPMI